MQMRRRRRHKSDCPPRGGSTSEGDEESQDESERSSSLTSDDHLLSNLRRSKRRQKDEDDSSSSHNTRLRSGVKVGKKKEYSPSPRRKRRTFSSPSKRNCRISAKLSSDDESEEEDEQEIKRKYRFMASRISSSKSPSKQLKKRKLPVRKARRKVSNANNSSSHNSTPEPSSSSAEQESEEESIRSSRTLRSAKLQNDLTPSRSKTASESGSESDGSIPRRELRPRKNGSGSTPSASLRRTSSPDSSDAYDSDSWQSKYQKKKSNGKAKEEKETIKTGASVSTATMRSSSNAQHKNSTRPQHHRSEESSDEDEDVEEYAETDEYDEYYDEYDSDDSGGDDLEDTPRIEERALRRLRRQEKERSSSTTRSVTPTIEKRVTRRRNGCPDATEGTRASAPVSKQQHKADIQAARKHPVTAKELDALQEEKKSKLEVWESREDRPMSSRMINQQETEMKRMKQVWLERERKIIQHHRSLTTSQNGTGRRQHDQIKVTRKAAALSEETKKESKKNTMLKRPANHEGPARRLLLEVKEKARDDLSIDHEEGSAEENDIDVVHDRCKHSGRRSILKKTSPRKLGRTDSPEIVEDDKRPRIPIAIPDHDKLLSPRFDPIFNTKYTGMDAKQYHEVMKSTLRLEAARAIFNGAERRPAIFLHRNLTFNRDQSFRDHRLYCFGQVPSKIIKHAWCPSTADKKEENKRGIFIQSCVSILKALPKFQIMVTAEERLSVPYNFSIRCILMWIRRGRPALLENAQFRRFAMRNMEDMKSEVKNFVKQHMNGWKSLREKVEESYWSSEADRVKQLSMIRRCTPVPIRLNGEKEIQKHHKQRSASAVNSPEKRTKRVQSSRIRKKSHSVSSDSSEEEPRHQIKDSPPKTISILAPLKRVPCSVATGPSTSYTPSAKRAKMDASVCSSSEESHDDSGEGEEGSREEESDEEVKDGNGGSTSPESDEEESSDSAAGEDHDKSCPCFNSKCPNAEQAGPSVKVEVVDLEEEEEEEGGEDKENKAKSKVVHVANTLIFKRVRHQTLPGKRNVHINAFFIIRRGLSFSLAKPVDNVPPFDMPVNDMSTITRPIKLDLPSHVSIAGLPEDTLVFLVLRLQFTGHPENGKVSRRATNDESDSSEGDSSSERGSPPRKTRKLNGTMDADIEIIEDGSDDSFENPLMYCCTPLISRKEGEDCARYLHGNRSMILVESEFAESERYWMRDAHFIPRLCELSKKLVGNPFVHMEVAEEVIEMSDGDESNTEGRTEVSPNDREVRYLRTQHFGGERPSRKLAEERLHKFLSTPPTKRLPSPLEGRVRRLRAMVDDITGLPIYAYLQAFCGMPGSGFSQEDLVALYATHKYIPRRSYTHDKEVIEKLAGVPFEDIIHDPTLAATIVLLTRLNFPRRIIYRIPGRAAPRDFLSKDDNISQPTIEPSPAPLEHRFPRPNIHQHSRSRRVADWKRRPFFLLSAKTTAKQTFRVLTYSEVQTLPTRLRREVIETQVAAIDSRHNVDFDALPGHEIQTNISLVGGLKTQLESRERKVSASKIRLVKRSRILTEQRQRALARKLMDVVHKNKERLQPRRQGKEEQTNEPVVDEDLDVEEGMRAEHAKKGLDLEIEEDLLRRHERILPRLRSPPPPGLAVIVAELSRDEELEEAPILNRIESPVEVDSSKEANAQENCEDLDDEAPVLFPINSCTPSDYAEESGDDDSLPPQLEEFASADAAELFVPSCAETDAEELVEEPHLPWLRREQHRNGERKRRTYPLTMLTAELRMQRMQNVAGLTPKERNEYELCKLFKIKKNQRMSVMARDRACKRYYFSLTRDHEMDKFREKWERRGVELDKWTRNPLSEAEYTLMNQKVTRSKEMGLVRASKDQKKRVVGHVEAGRRDDVKARLTDLRQRVGVGLKSPPRRSQMHPKDSHELLWDETIEAKPSNCILCSKTTNNMFSLMMHYTLSHPRLQFLLKPVVRSGINYAADNGRFPIPDELVIEVKLDPHADTVKELLDMEAVKNENPLSVPSARIRRSALPVHLKAIKSHQPIYIVCPFETRMLRSFMRRDMTLFTEKIFTPENIRRLQMERVLHDTPMELSLQKDHRNGPGSLDISTHMCWFRSKLKRIQHRPWYPADPLIDVGFQVIWMYMEACLSRGQSIASCYMKWRLFLRCCLHIVKENMGALYHSMMITLVQHRRMGILQQYDFDDISYRLSWYMKRREWHGEMDFDPLKSQRSPVYQDTLAFLRRKYVEWKCKKETAVKQLRAYQRETVREKRITRNEGKAGDDKTPPSIPPPVRVVVPPEFRRDPETLEESDLYQRMRAAAKSRDDRKWRQHLISEIEYFFNTKDAAQIPEWFFVPAEFITNLVTVVPHTRVLNPHIGPACYTRHYIAARVEDVCKKRAEREKLKMQHLMIRYHDNERRARISMRHTRFPEGPPRSWKEKHDALK